jgi:hypothetical protein
MVKNFPPPQKKKKNKNKNSGLATLVEYGCQKFLLNTSSPASI